MTYPLSADFCAKFNITTPPLPYVKGQRLIVRSHYPPSPNVGSCTLSPNTAYERESNHPLERCLLHPPLPGSDGLHTLQLRIVETIRVGDNQSAQLAAVQVLDPLHPMIYRRRSLWLPKLTLCTLIINRMMQTRSSAQIAIIHTRLQPTWLSRNCKEQ